MKFQEWESKEILEGRIDKSTIEYLVIPNNLEFENDELVIEGYPQLKELIAFSCALKRVKINAPKLEILNLSDNQLTELDVSGITLLKNLTFGDNRTLKRIIGLENLKQLEELNCFKCRLESLDCSNNKELRYLFCANQILTLFSLKIQGCDNLEILDCAENKIISLDCSNLTKLKDVSCKEVANSVLNNNLFKFLNEEELISKEKLISIIKRYYQISKDAIQKSCFNKEETREEFLNGIDVWSNFLISFFEKDEEAFYSKKSIIDKLKLDANFENCTSLERLNFSKSNIGSLNVNNCRSLKGVIGGWTVLVPDLDENGNEKRFINPETRLIEIRMKMAKPLRDLVNEPWYDVDEFWKDDTKFPKLTLIDIDNDKANELEDLEYGERIYSEQQERARENIERHRHLYYGTTHLDFSHMKFTAMNIDGSNYPETITHINLGDNYLRSLKIANFPNLEWLVVSHNTALIWGETFIIENCPNLDINCLHHYKSADESRGTPEDGREYNEETDNPLKQQAQEEEKKAEIKAKLNEQVRNILAKDAKDVTLSELLNLISETFFKDLAEDLRMPFHNLFTQKLESHVGDLIKQSKVGNLNQDQLLVEVKLIEKFLYLLSEETKIQLRTLIESFNQKEQTLVKGISYVPFYLIFVIAWMRVGFLLLSKKKNSLKISSWIPTSKT